MEKIKNWILSNDYFGKTVQLRVSRQENTYNTTLGGFCSLLIKIGLAYYLGTLIRLMVNYGDDKISSHTSPLDYDAVGKVAYSDMNFNYIPSLSSNNNLSIFNLDEEIRRHVTIVYQQLNYYFT